METKEQLQLVSFEQAKKLSQLGFNWECEYISDYPIYLSDGQVFDGDEYLQPTVSLALKWFRDVKAIPNSVEISRMTKNGYPVGKYTYSFIFNGLPLFDNDIFYNYEEAEIALLDRILFFRR